MRVVLLFLIIGIVIAFEVPQLVHTKAKRELIAFSVLLIIGTGYSLGYVLDFQTPNPTAVVELFFGDTGKAIQNLLR